MRRTVAMLLIALVIAASGVALASYAVSDDDAPGGVLIGLLLVGGAVALGVRAFQRRRPKPE
jgi:MYXO-CTERM domain-containing protein